MDIHLVGYRAEVIFALCETLVVSHNPLTRLLELDDGIAQFLDYSVRCATRTLETDVDTLDALIVGCCVQCLQCAVERD